MSELPDDLVRHLDATQTVAIVTTRRDGSRVATPIWAVVVDGIAYARAAYGPGTAWYRRALSGRPVGFTLGNGRIAERDREAALRDEIVDVRARYVPADDPVQARVDEAFRRKYEPTARRVVPSIMTPEVVACTIAAEL